MGLICKIVVYMLDVVLIDVDNLICDVFEELIFVFGLFDWLVVMFVLGGFGGLVCIVVEVGIFVYVVDGLQLNRF